MMDIDNPVPDSGLTEMRFRQPVRVSEAECRRDDFVGGFPVKMINGEEWFFAEPRMRFVPTNSEVGFEVILSLDDDGEFDGMYTRYAELSVLGRDEIRAHAMEYSALEVRLARAMLERNYELSLSQLRRILQFSYDTQGDPAGAEIRSGIAQVLSGASVPKRSAGGDEPSPTPPAHSSSTTAC